MAVMLLLKIKKKLSFILDQTWWPSYFVLLVVPFLVLNKFADPYTTVKWFASLSCILVSIFAFLLKSKSFILPSIPQPIFYILISILVILIFNSYFHNVHLLSYENVRRFLFLGGVIYFYNRFIQNPDDFEKLEKSIVISSFIFVVAALAQHLLIPEEQSFLTFGNINLSAEFVAFSLAFQWSALGKKWKENLKSNPLNILVSLSICYLYISNCRSVFIAVILMLLFSLYYFKERRFEILKIILLSALLVALIKAFIFYFYPDSELKLLTDKSYTARWEIYIATLKMILNNPLGAGIGQYEFVSVPYLGALPSLNEFYVFRTPHNDFLYSLSEDGILFSFLFFAAACAFCYLYWKEIKKVFTHHPIFYFFLFVTFSQALFQFPTTEPLPYFMLCMTLGYFFSILKHEKVEIQLKPRLRLSLLICNTAAFIILVLTFAGLFVSYSYPTHKALNELACAYGNRNWSACLNVSDIAMREKKYDVAETYALKTLAWQPMNFQGIKMLAFANLYQGHHRKACRLFNAFDAMFHYQTILHPYIQKTCSPPPHSSAPPQPSLGERK